MSYIPITGSKIRPHTTSFSPVGLWQLNGTLVDTSGDGYDMNASSGTVRYGEVGTGLLGLALDGASGVKRTTVTSALNIVGDMTIEAIVNLAAPVIINNVGTIVTCGASGETLNDNYLYEMNFTAPASGTAGANQIKSFWEFSTGTNVDTATGVYVPVGQPIHMASVRSGTTPTVSLATYVNGVLQNTTTGLTSPEIGGSPAQIVSIGYEATAGSQQFFNGTIASVKIINSALTAAQIKSEYDYCFGLYR